MTNKVIYNFETEKEEISQLLYELRDKKIIFTNGCFDLIHTNHINLLSKSKDLGDVLIVGVNSDHSVKLLKGDDRPIVSESSRVYTLSGLRSVDYIILFDDYSVDSLVRFIKPDIITKGGDYTVDQLDNVGGTFMKESGGKTIIISNREEMSTSDLISKILKIYNK
jgi:rfaE bifunctional protein nucleotidyltransferase chain/domain